MRQRRQAWIIGVVLASVSALAACGASSRSAATVAGTATPPPTATATATAVPSPTPLPTLALKWELQNLLQTQGLASGYGWEVAADGTTFYGCTQVEGATSGDASVTYDRGAHVQSTTVPMANHGGFCVPWPDEGSAQVSFIKMVSDGHGPYLMSTSASPHSAPGPGTDRFDVYTTDGGQSWAVLPNDVIMDEADTVGGATYALIATVQQPQNVELARSDDGLATWQKLTLPMTNTIDLAPTDPTDYSQAQRHLWVNPDGQQMVFADTNSGILAASSDGGQTWQTLTPPSTPVSDIAVQPPVAGRAWVLCVRSATVTACSHDGGHTWAQQSQVALTYSPQLLGVTPSGDLLAVGSLPGGSEVVQRLRPGGQQWQVVGLVPGSFIRYFPVSETGVLWSYVGMTTPQFPIQGWYEATYAPQ